MGERNLEQELVKEGIRQILKGGLEGFSGRSVAEACHVSCAAPFKHFNGRRGFFQCISQELDKELMGIMEKICVQYPEDEKMAHICMSEAYISHLCKYPFLMDSSFWHTIDKKQAAIREWRSFQLMREKQHMFCEKNGISPQVEKKYYYEFQIAAYGSAYAINARLTLDGTDVAERIREIHLRIYKDMEKTSS